MPVNTTWQGQDHVLPRIWKQQRNKSLNSLCSMHFLRVWAWLVELVTHFLEQHAEVLPETDDCVKVARKHCKPIPSKPYRHIGPPTSHWTTEAPRSILGFCLHRPNTSLVAEWSSASIRLVCLLDSLLFLVLVMSLETWSRRLPPLSLALHHSNFQADVQTDDHSKVVPGSPPLLCRDNVPSSHFLKHLVTFRRLKIYAKKQNRAICFQVKMPSENWPL